MTAATKLSKASSLAATQISENFELYFKSSAYFMFGFKAFQTIWGLEDRYGFGQLGRKYLGDRDSNPDFVVQSHTSCRWTIPQGTD